MTTQTFALDQPVLHTTTRLAPRFVIGFVLLLGASICWLLIYGWLGWHFWVRGVNLSDGVSQGLLILSVVLGAVTVFGWFWFWPRRYAWRQSRRRVPGLDELKTMEPFAFEAFIAQEIFVARGYTVQNVQDVKDGGVDVLVTDGAGVTSIVQCKRYKHTVGEPFVRDLYGTLIHNRADPRLSLRHQRDQRRGTGVCGGQADHVNRWGATDPTFGARISVKPEIFDLPSDITDQETIAVNRSIREVRDLNRRFGVGRWRRRKGIAMIQFKLSGRVVRAEVHWYEAQGVGSVRWKVKRELT